MASPAYRAVGQQQSAGTTSIDIPKPTGTAENDILILFFYWENNSAVTITPPSGFAEYTSAARDNTGPNPDFHVRVYWKRAGASEGASYTVGLSSSSACIGTLAAFSGAITSGTPLEAAGVTSGNSTSCTLPSITTLTAETLRIGYASSYDWTKTWSSSAMTERSDSQGQAIYTEAQASAGASGTELITQSGTDQFIGVHLSLASTSGSVTITLNAATATASPQALTVSPGAVTVSVNAAALSAAPQAITISAPPAGVNVSLNAATLTASPQAITAAPGAVTVSLSVANLSAAAQAATVIPGAISVNLNAALLAAGPQALSISPGAVTVSLGAVTLTASAQAVTAVPGAVTITLGAATLSAEAQGITISAPGAGEVVVTLNAAALVASPQGLTVGPGAVTVSLAAATLAAGPQGMTVTPGTVTVSLGAAGISASAGSITVDAGAISPTIVTLSAAAVSTSAGALVVVPGAVTVSLGIASLIAAAQGTSIYAPTSTQINQYVSLTILGRDSGLTVPARSAALELFSRSRGMTIDLRDYIELYPSDLLLYDSFTGLDGALLSARMPEKGGPWVDSRPSIDILSNQAHFKSGSTAPVVATVDITTPVNCTMSCLIKGLATGGAGGFFFRYNGGLNYHCVLMTILGGVTGKVEIIRRTPLAVLATTGSISIVTNSTYALELVLNGNDITATIRGYLLEGTTISASDATNANVTPKGIMFDNANCRIDELQVAP